MSSCFWQSPEKICNRGQVFLNCNPVDGVQDRLCPVVADEHVQDKGFTGNVGPESFPQFICDDTIIDRDRDAAALEDRYRWWGWKNKARLLVTNLIGEGIHVRIHLGLAW